MHSTTPKGDLRTWPIIPWWKISLDETRSSSLSAPMVSTIYSIVLSNSFSESEWDLPISHIKRLTISGRFSRILTVNLWTHLIRSSTDMVGQTPRPLLYASEAAASAPRTSLSVKSGKLPSSFLDNSPFSPSFTYTGEYTSLNGPFHVFSSPPTRYSFWLITDFIRYSCGTAFSQQNIDFICSSVFIIVLN